MEFHEDPNHPLSRANFDKLLRQAISEIKAEETTQTQLQESGLKDQAIEQHVSAASERLLDQVGSFAGTYDQALAIVRAKEEQLVVEPPSNGFWQVALRNPQPFVARALGLLIALVFMSFLVVYLFGLEGLSGLYYAVTIGGIILLILAMVGIVVLVPDIFSGLRDQELAWETERAKPVRADAEKKIGLDVSRQELLRYVETINRELKDQIKEQARAFINQHLSFDYSTTFGVTDAPGLSEVMDDARRTVDTSAKRSLFYLLNNMSGGSIGIAGPRGAGKSTLIQACCGDTRVLTKIKEFEVIPLFTSAPVQYDPRDFILYLFSSICQKVIARTDPAYQLDRGPIGHGFGDGPAQALGRVLPPAASLAVLIGLFLSVIGLGLATMLAATAPPASTKNSTSTTSKQRAADNSSANANVEVPAPGGESSAQTSGDADTGAGEGAATQEQPENAGTGAHAFLKALEIKPGWFLSWGVFLLVGGFALNFFARTVRPAEDLPRSFEEYASATDEQRRRWKGRARFYSRPFAISIFGLLFSSRRWQVDRVEHYERRYNSEMPRPDNALVLEARRLLHDIKFQQSYTSGWSGAIKLPVGIEGGISNAVTLAQRQMSNPEIVAEFKNFLGMIARTYAIVIGIDELDKIESDEGAHTFLNEIKSIFGLQNCFYLISVSENAMSNFERRGLPFRDVFDSSFDNVVYVNYLDHEGARNLLARRIVGRPIPFIYLSYCFSGGLPRDLIRTFRNLREISQDAGQASSLSALCTKLVSMDAAAKLRAVKFIIRKAEPPLHDAGELIEILHRVENDPLAAGKLLSNSEELYAWRVPPRTPAANGDEKRESDRLRLEALATELGAYYYFLATMLEFFNDTLHEPKLAKAEADGHLELLARARQGMSVDTRITVGLLNKFRAEHLMPVPPRLTF